MRRGARFTYLLAATPSVSLSGDASCLWSVGGQNVEAVRGTVGLKVTR